MGLWEILKGEQPGLFRTLANYENPGQFGEYATEFALTANENIQGDFVVLKNVYLPLKGKTTEIDLLMLHEKGLYVFESKNYSGWIFDDAEQLKWTQCLESGQKNHFYNPIRQNQTHIQALAAYLELPSSAFHSYIVFSERCRLKKVPEDTDRVVIVRRPDMLKKLRAELKGSPVIFSHEALLALQTKLAGAVNRTEEEKRQHIEDIQTKCPYCGGKLVLRKGKYGQFWGCSAYPRCRFTRPLDAK